METNYKTRILFLLFALGNIGLIAQEYKPINFKDGIWHVDTFEKEGYSTEDQYYCIGDTLINDTSYAKLYLSRFSYSWMGGRDSLIKEYTGAISNMDDKTVRFVPYGHTKSMQIYDFNLQLGDTVNLQYNSIIIFGIDSIEFCGGYHKRYYQTLGLFPIAIIEGIGYSNGLLGFFEYRIGEGENTSTLECYNEKNNPSCQACPYILGVESETSKFSIYPNPTNNKITINATEELCEVQLYDLHGRLLYNKEGHSQFSSVIDLSGFSSGEYWLNIILSTGSSHSAIILKTNQ